ncbi:MAG TPA: response regulator transcription factor [Bdellovibrionales bacterium]|nr:response regulator transcription factor [Bdellovibrionales bacterium]
MAKILVVEDSSESYQLIHRMLSGSAHLDWAKTQKEAAALLEKKEFDLILLDVVLPDGDGYQLCSLIQAHEKWNLTPIIFLTAKNSVSDRVLGFAIGADDFVSKPFDALELKARIDSKLRKRERALNDLDNIRIGALEINKSSQRVFVSENGESRQLDLTPLEFKILLLLASKPNVVVTRDEILDSVWGKNVHVYSRSVDTHMSKLRKKLEEHSHYISSVHGSGYRFEFVASQKNILPLGPDGAHQDLRSGTMVQGL